MGVVVERRLGKDSLLVLHQIEVPLDSVGGRGCWKEREVWQDLILELHLMGVKIINAQKRRRHCRCREAWWRTLPGDEQP